MAGWTNQTMYDVDPEKLRGLRRSWFMTQREFATFVGLETSTISNLEGGGNVRRHGCRGATLKRIMQATGCQADDLLREKVSA